MKHRAAWARFFLVASLLTAAMIFSFSAQAGEESQQLSDGVTDQVARVVRPNYKQLPVDEQLSFLEMLSRIIRKCAHFGEFALLGFNLTGFFRFLRWEGPPRAAALPAWLIATAYAATDELHQLFVSGRAPGVLDVGIDSAGALAGIFVALALLGPALRRFRRA